MRINKWYYIGKCMKVALWNWRDWKIVRGVNIVDRNVNRIIWWQIDIGYFSIQGLRRMK